MKENLVIIHGWRDKIESYQKIAESLKENFNVYLIKIAGFDKELNKPYYFKDYLKDVENELKDLKDFYLLGHSFGGSLALLYALKNEKRVKKLILYNAAIIREKSLKKNIFSLLAKFLKKIERILPKKISWLIKKIIYRFIIKSYDYFLVDEKLKKTFININKDLKREAELLKVKTIILWGKNDKVTPLAQARLLKKLIKNSRLIVVPGGHSLHKENHLAFIRIIKKVLK